MACVDTNPNCGDANVAATPESLRDVAEKIVIIFGLAGLAISIGKAIGAIKVVNGVVSIGGVGIGSGLFVGGAIGLAVAVTTLIIISNSARDRCNPSTAESQCIAGVVNNIVPSFSSGWDDWAPWQAMHDRVDVIVKSFYWQIVELGNAHVFCTDEARPRRSEILRCYFFEQRVCDAANGAVTGAAVAAVPAVLVAAGIAALMCVTVVLCVIGLLLAAAAALAIVLGGAAIGGQIAKSNSENADPTADTGQTLSIGHLVTVNGPMEPRGYDDGANVIYWASGAQFHGMSMSPQPYSYCEINDEFEDGCSRGPVIE